MNTEQHELDTEGPVEKKPYGVEEILNTKIQNFINQLFEAAITDKPKQAEYLDLLNIYFFEFKAADTFLELIADRLYDANNEQLALFEESFFMIANQCPSIAKHSIIVNIYHLIKDFSRILSNTEYKLNIVSALDSLSEKMNTEKPADQFAKLITDMCAIVSNLQTIPTMNRLFYEERSPKKSLSVLKKAKINDYQLTADIQQHIKHLFSIFNDNIENIFTHKLIPSPEGMSIITKQFIFLLLYSHPHFIKKIETDAKDPYQLLIALFGKTHANVNFRDSLAFSQENHSPDIATPYFIYLYALQAYIVNHVTTHQNGMLGLAHLNKQIELLKHMQPFDEASILKYLRRNQVNLQINLASNIQKIQIEHSNQLPISRPATPDRTPSPLANALRKYSEDVERKSPEKINEIRQLLKCTKQALVTLKMGTTDIIAFMKNLVPEIFYELSLELKILVNLAKNPFSESYLANMQPRIKDTEHGSKHDPVLAATLFHHLQTVNSASTQPEGLTAQTERRNTTPVLARAHARYLMPDLFPNKSSGNIPPPANNNNGLSCNYGKRSN